MKKGSDVFLGGFYMGIVVNFVLVKFFRPVKHRAKPPEYLCATRIVLASCAQIKRITKIEFFVGKKLKN